VSDPGPEQQLEFDLDPAPQPAAVPDPEPEEVQQLERQSMDQLEFDWNPNTQLLVLEPESWSRHQEDRVRTPMVSSGTCLRGPVQVPAILEPQVIQPPDKIPVP
jgi:hypothetical protein